MVRRERARTTEVDDGAPAGHGQAAGAGKPGMLADDVRVEDWLEAIVVVAFHVEHGQVIEDVYSLSEPLSEAAKRKICSLSLPDSNSGQNGDVQFVFRYRNSACPLSVARHEEQDFRYCSAFFRQIKDKTLKRGYFQKSVVLVSKNPYTRFLEECTYIVGPLFFEFGKSVLEAMLQNIKSWPAPEAGRTFRLPLAGCIIETTLPLAHREVDGCGQGSLLNKFRQDETGGPERQFVYESSGGGHILKRQELMQHRRAKSERLRSSSSSSSSSSSYAASAASAGNRKLSTDGEEEVLLDLNDFERMAKQHERQEEAAATHAAQDGAASAGVSPGQAPPPEPGGEAGGTPERGGEATSGAVAMRDVFEGKAERVPGLFQEVPLFSTFGGLSVALWHIWELALSGEPILVLAPTPDRCSQAVLAIAGLIAPIAYMGDYRPYFTIYDSDFMEVSKKHDELRGQSMPACVFGVTNPYFLKSLEYWPNVISMGGVGPSTTALARSLTPPPLDGAANGSPCASPPKIRSAGGAASGPEAGGEARAGNRVRRGRTRSRAMEDEARFHRILQSSRRMNRLSSSLGGNLSRNESLSVEGRDIKTARYHPTVARRGDSLRALLTDQKYERSIILTRDQPLLTPDKAVLRQLLNERDAAKANSVVLDEQPSVEPPALALNNALLRCHFQHLTKVFLRPLEDFLRLGSVGSRAARREGISLSAYEQPGLLQERFNEELFFQELERSPPPKELQRCDWRTLYRRFIRGPHFASWFERQRVKLESQLRIIYRHLRLSMDSDILLQAAGAGQSVRRRILADLAAASPEMSATAQPGGNDDNGNGNGNDDDEEPPPSAALDADVRRDKATSIYKRAKTALEQELAKGDAERDQELVAKIQEHLTVVRELLSA